VTSTPDNYFALMVNCRATYEQKKASEIDCFKRGIYLRHDVEFTLRGWEFIPYLEASLKMFHTYYIRVDSYNVFEPYNRKLLRDIVSLGHDIGLHYDPRRTRTEEDLDDQLKTLEKAIGRPVDTITQHYAHLGQQTDPFVHHEKNVISRNIDKMLYVSDSARGWRDDGSYLTELRSGNRGSVLLLTHPENWMDGSITDSKRYYDEVLEKHIDSTREERLEHIDLIVENHEAYTGERNRKLFSYNIRKENNKK